MRISINPVKSIGSFMIRGKSEIYRLFQKGKINPWGWKREVYTYFQLSTHMNCFILTGLCVEISITVCAHKSPWYVCIHLENVYAIKSKLCVCKYKCTVCKLCNAFRLISNAQENNPDQSERLEVIQFSSI